MSRLPYEIEQLAARVGVKLETTEVGFSRHEALEALKLLDGTRVIVFGGDVYRKELNGWTPTYDNWSCEPQPTESEAEFAMRSRAKARDYISKYPDAGGSLLFVMVF